MPPPFTRWHAAQWFAWYTSAPCTAKSGALSSAAAFFSFSFNRNAASEFNCASVNWMGGIEVPGRIAEGRLKC